MGFSVDSYLEIFTLILGWQLYDVIWDVLAATGIVFLPFLGILIDHWTNGFVDGEEGNGAARTVRAMEVDIYLALTVVMLACVPTGLTAVNSANVTYTPPASTINPSPTTATGAAPGSTFGSTFGATTPGSAKLPVWWYSVLALSAGIDEAIISGSGLTVQNLAAIRQAAQQASIENPQLRSQVTRFYNECFVPARTAFMQENPLSASAASAISTYGLSDPDWIGSHAFQNDPSLYPVMFATSAVAGWPFNPATQPNLAGGTVVPTTGTPSCLQWWSDPTLGLEAQLVAAAGSTSNLPSLVSTFGSTLSTAQQQDIIAKSLVDNSGLFTSASANALTPTSSNPLSSILQGSATSIATGISTFFTWLAMSVVKPALPFVQALILMGIAIFLPFVMILSRYSLSAMILGALAIFSVKFWSVIWFVVQFLEDNLITSVFPGSQSLLTALASLFTFNNTQKGAILGLTIMGMYLGFPALWSGLMTMIGIRAGAAVSGAKAHALEHAQGSGTMAAGLGRTMGRAGVGALGRGARAGVRLLRRG